MHPRGILEICCLYSICRSHECCVPQWVRQFHTTTGIILHPTQLFNVLQDIPADEKPIYKYLSLNHNSISHRHTHTHSPLQGDLFSFLWNKIPVLTFHVSFYPASHSPLNSERGRGREDSKEKKNRRHGARKRVEEDFTLNSLQTFSGLASNDEHKIIFFISSWDITTIHSHRNY